MVAVTRHKTAIARSQLSTPMQMLARHGFLDGNHSVLDYGCGRGDDLAILQEAQLCARGWDPHYVPDSDLSEPADVVNLGFVINVIEEPEERVETLRKAFSLCRQCLSVAVMIAGRAQTEGMEPYRDGHVSKRGTFQKYYRQSEFMGFVERALGKEPVTVCSGVVFVFRDKVAEQRFFRNRYRRKPRLAELLEIVSPLTAKRARSRKTITEQYWATLRELWQKVIELGRLPELDELNPDLGEILVGELGSVRRAAALARRAFGLKALNEAEAARKQDLAVYFALEAFNRRPRYRELPIELQRDIKAFFGAYKNAAEAGRELLFSVGDPETLLSACQEAGEQGLGHLDGDHSLQLHTSLVQRLPPALRVYVGCAERFHGDIENADLVKIHIQSGKLTLLHFDDFEGKPLPAMVERVKVKLRQLEIDYFDYRRYGPPPVLYMKSRYMAADQPGHEKQRAFDEQLLALTEFDYSSYGPDPRTFWRALEELKLEIRDFELVRK